VNDSKEHIAYSLYQRSYSALNTMQRMRVDMELALCVQENETKEGGKDGKE
jgi:hypothetical protein